MHSFPARPIKSGCFPLTMSTANNCWSSLSVSLILHVIVKSSDRTALRQRAPPSARTHPWRRATIWSQLVIVYCTRPWIMCPLRRCAYLSRTWGPVAVGWPVSAVTSSGAALLRRLRTPAANPSPHPSHSSCFPTFCRNVKCQGYELCCTWSLIMMSIDIGVAARIIICDHYIMSYTYNYVQ